MANFNISEKSLQDIVADGINQFISNNVKKENELAKITINEIIEFSRNWIPKRMRLNMYDDVEKDNFDTYKRE